MANQHQGKCPVRVELLLPARGVADNVDKRAPLANQEGAEPL
jgi:hypothetical protein